MLKAFLLYHGYNILPEEIILFTVKPFEEFQRMLISVVHSGIRILQSSPRVLKATAALTHVGITLGGCC